MGCGTLADLCLRVQTEQIAEIAEEVEHNRSCQRGE